MSFRAVIIGLALGLFLACFGWFNDWVLDQAYIASDLAPVSVLGLLVLGLLAVNPLLRLCRLGAMSGAEWCVVTALALAAVAIPGPGLMWYFSDAVVQPHHFNTVYPGWQDDRLLSYVPEAMLVDPGDASVVEGFRMGAGTAQQDVGFSDVPWHAWRRTLGFWLPLIGLGYVAALAAMLVVHRQWAHRERLRYPIAQIVAGLTEVPEGRAWPTVFRERLFWFGFLPACVLLSYKGLTTYFPEMPELRLGINVRSLLATMPLVRQAPHAWSLMNPELFFAVVGLAYFIGTDVALSVGLAPILFTAVFAGLMGLGVNLSGHYFSGGPTSAQLFGSYLGMGLVVLYLGRRFYLDVLLSAFGARRDAIPGTARWACRIGLLAAAGMVLMLILVVQLHWLLAILFVLLVGLLLLVLTRVNVEAGLFFIQPSWQAVSVLVGLFGAAALGPNMLVTLGLLCVVLTLDPRVCFMPLAANALWFTEVRGVRPRKTGWLLGVSVLLALVIGVFSTVWLQYRHAGGSQYGWAAEATTFPFTMLQEQLQAHPDAAGASFDWQAITPNSSFLLAAGIGVALVIGAQALRLRFPRWPLHPMLFLVWGTLPVYWMGPSILIGCVLKLAITRLGGESAYTRAKPLFLGLIAGEFIAGILWMGVGLLYFLHTGYAGPTFRTHP